MRFFLSFHISLLQNCSNLRWTKRWTAVRIRGEYKFVHQNRFKHLFVKSLRSWDLIQLGVFCVHFSGSVSDLRAEFIQSKWKQYEEHKHIRRSFYTAPEPQVDGKSPVYVRIVVNKSRCELALKCYLKKEDWNAARGLARPKNDELKQLNTYLEDVRARIINPTWNDRKRW